MEKIKKNWLIILLLLAIAGCVFILNIATLYSPDDYSYANVIGGDDLKITSFSEVIQDAKYLYTNWTGRIIPHLLIGFFMTTNTVFFKILNTILFVVLLLLTTKFITRKTSYLSIIVAFGFLVYGKMFGEKFAWISGSLNYLWTSAALIAYLYAIYGYFVENKKEKIEKDNENRASDDKSLEIFNSCNLKKWQKVLIVISGFLIAFSHEVMAFVGGSFLGILFLVNILKIWKKSKSDAVFLVSCILFFGIGAILTIIAPGNVARSTLDIKIDGSPLACLGNYKDIKYQLFITLATIIGVGVLKQKELIKKEIMYFMFPCIIATVPFSIMGYFPPRTFVPYEALIIAITTANIQVICEHFKEHKKWIIGISCIVTVIVFARMLPTTYSDIRYILPYKLKVTKQLEKAKNTGEKDLVVSKFLFMDKIRREDLINIDNFFLETSSDAAPNLFTSIYYKFDKITAISDIDYIVEIYTDITQSVDYGIINKETLELISIANASDKIVFTIPKAQLGTYVVDCRDKDLRTHVTGVRIRAVGEEIENPDLEILINQAKN